MVPEGPVIWSCRRSIGHLAIVQAKRFHEHPVASILETRVLIDQCNIAALH